MDRRLAAILAADVVGFSRHMGANAVGILAQWPSQRREMPAADPPKKQRQLYADRSARCSLTERGVAR